MKFFEEIDVGEATDLGSHTFAVEEIRRFARAFDPQRFHLDEAEAAKTHFGRLSASGWHTAAIFMKLWTAAMAADTDTRAARGIASARIGPSPGFRDLKWPKPVFAGDTISYRSQCVEKIESRSKPDWGIVTNLNSATNRAGEPVLEFRAAVFIERRPAR